jgi:DNA-damage-inducible protein D
VGHHNLQFKDLPKRAKLREHMTDLEIILNMLGEATATRLHQDRDTQGFENLQGDAKEAGDVAGNTRRDIEARTGTPVVSPSNYLHLTQGKKKKPGQVETKQHTDQQPELPQD